MRVTTNDAEVARLLRAVGAKKAKAGLRKGSRAACKILLPVIKAEFPEKTGTAKKAFKVRALPRSRTRVGTQVRGLVAGGAAYYIAFVELGTRQLKRGNFIQGGVASSGSGAIKVFIDTTIAEIEKP